MTFPIDIVRDSFPALGITDARDKPIVYFDNPAGTQVPGSVALAISDAILYANANLGGAFRSSQLAGEIYQKAHQVMAEFFGAPAREDSVVIAQSMTAITMNIARALSLQWRRGEEIIVTSSDHDGNVSPWILAAMDQGVTVKMLKFREDSWSLHPDDLKKLLTSKTRLLALNHANNMTGTVNDIAPLIGLAHEADVQCYVDSVQYAPHRLIDFPALDADYLVCSSYKFFGPHLGIMIGKPELLERLEAYKVRPAPDHGSGKFEQGTPQIELLAGLIATVEYWADLGRICVGADETLPRRTALQKAFAACELHERGLSKALLTGLSGLEGIKVLGITDQNRLDWRVPTISVVHQKIPSRTIAAELAKRGVSCWSGHNYALETAEQLGLDLQDGVVRLGMAHYNTEAEVTRVLGHLEAIIADQDATDDTSGASRP